MLSALIPSERSYSAMQLAPQQMHQRFVQPGPLVLESDPLKFPTPTTDRDRTVSRRSEPSSRATLMGEQPNPWDLLQPQDVTSRHRGAKPRRRCELLGGISLLSPEYLLSVERWPFHTEPPDHQDLLSYLLDVSVSQSSALMPLYSLHDFRPC
uniref:Cell wall-associated hydrolase n=1 Tax=Trepomonas sp. PC1 TaxID=1076344 RepID=A0A146KEX6_9EUKA|eukprot:JAP94434.1 Cell wall-associated hydrolase [Trepomonas sp. PC1]